MNKMNNTTGGGGIGFFGLLAIVFIVLKLTGFINWSWWAVLAPAWIRFVLMAAVLLLAVFRDWKLKRTIDKAIKNSNPD